MDTNDAGFYHLNCEHGTGESICEFSNSTDLDVYGLKTEGRFVTLCAEPPARLQSCIIFSNRVRVNRDRLLACIVGIGGCATVIESLCSVLVDVAALQMTLSTHLTL